MDEDEFLRELAKYRTVRSREFIKAPKKVVALVCVKKQANLIEFICEGNKVICDPQVRAPRFCSCYNWCFVQSDKISFPEGRGCCIGCGKTKSMENAGG
jgi:hypothetical protein